MTSRPEPTSTTHLPRAPIVEATLYIRVRMPPTVTTETLAGLNEQYRDKYPTRQVRMSDLPLGSLEAATAQSRESAVRHATGYVYTSPDGRDVVQARLDGFSFTRLKPYTSWEQVVREAQRLWSIYADVAGPERLQYIGLRYINRVLIPTTAERYEDYLLTLPTIAPGLAQEPSAFFLLLTLPYRDPDSVATVTVSSAAPTEREDGTPIIFDVDVSANATPAMSGEALWTAFEGLRTIKNQIFFRSMTEKTRGMFR